MIMYNDNNENDSQYRYSGSDIPYNNTNNSSTANNNTAFSSAPYEAKKHKKHKGGFAKKAACFVLSAVLFGAIAGSVMFGVNYAGGKIAGSNKYDATGVNIPTVSNNISNVAKTDSSLTEDTNLSFAGGMMSLLRLPRGKLPLAFLAVPAGKDGRVECPCQTVNDFIGIRGSVCGLFLFVQTHAPLIVPPWQSRARKSKFQFLSGARARMLSALLLRLVAR